MLNSLIVEAQQHHRAGRLAEAIAAYRRAIDEQPDVAEVHNNLGSALVDAQQPVEAAAEFLRAAELKPSLFQPHNSLGDIYYAQGKLREAAARYRQAIALRPDLAEAHCNLGAILGQLNQFAEAAAHCERALALKPGLFQAHENLGKILHRQGHFAEAAARFRQVIAMRPDHGRAYHNLGDALKELGEWQEAAARYQQALALRPGMYQTQNNLGAVLRKQGKLDEAVARFEQAIALKPDLASTYNNLGNVLKQQGKFAQALAVYDQALALDPDFADVHYVRSDLKKFERGDADLAALEAFAAQPDRLPPSEMVFIHFALAKALDDVGDYERAFAHLAQANALKRRQVDYNEAAMLGDLRRIAETFDAALLARLGGSGEPRPTPIFVLGMPRSGTTLTEQILASHPQVYPAGELANLDDALDTVADAAHQTIPYPACMHGLQPDDMRRLGATYLDSLPPLPEGKTRLVDKMPMNFAYIGLIHLILPGARIIHTVRDPLDTCLSCYSKLFLSGLTYSYDQTELGHYWRGYHALMEHWRSVLPAGSFLDVRYEDLVNDLEREARRMLDFCQLPWDDRCLAFHETERPISTPSNVQVRRPIYRHSVERWRRYAAHLGPLQEALGLGP